MQFDILHCPKKLLLEQEKQLIMNYEPLTLKSMESPNYECNTKVCKMQAMPAQIDKSLSWNSLL